MMTNERKHEIPSCFAAEYGADDIIADIEDCDAMIVRTAKISRRVIEAAPKLKIMSRHGAGYDNVDLDACRERGILVCTAGGANAISVAEVTIFYMLYCSRKFKMVTENMTRDYRIRGAGAAGAAEVNRSETA